MEEREHDEGRVKVEWEGEEYSKNSSLQESDAVYFMSREQFPKFTRTEGSVIVDIGCGDGRLTRRIFDKVGGRVYGIDITSKQIEHANAAHAIETDNSALKFFVIDATEIETLPNQYPNEISQIEGVVDRIVSFSCLHWITNHQLLFTKLFQILKAGGRVDIMFPWHSSNFYKWSEIVKRTPRFVEKNARMPMPPWLDVDLKFEILRSSGAIFGVNDRDGGDDNDASYNAEIAFNAGEKCSDLLLDIYRGWLRDIGFEVEFCDVSNDDPFVYSNQADFEGFVYQWFPRVCDSADDQKELVHYFVDLIKPTLGETGFTLALNKLHLHLRKPS